MVIHSHIFLLKKNSTKKEESSQLSSFLLLFFWATSLLLLLATISSSSSWLFTSFFLLATVSLFLLLLGDFSYLATIHLLHCYTHPFFSSWLLASSSYWLLLTFCFSSSCLVPFLFLVTSLFLFGYNLLLLHGYSIPFLLIGSSSPSCSSSYWLLAFSSYGWLATFLLLILFSSNCLLSPILVLVILGYYPFPWLFTSFSSYWLLHHFFATSIFLLATISLLAVHILLLAY